MLLAKSLLPVDKMATAPSVCLPGPMVSLSLSFQKTGILAAPVTLFPLQAESPCHRWPKATELGGVVSGRGCARELVCLDGSFLHVPAAFPP